MVLSLVPATASASETTNVAKIGDVEHATLQAAIDAVVNGQTITLLQDCTDNATLTSGKNITIDGNGKTFTGKIPSMLITTAMNCCMQLSALRMALL